MSNSFPVVTDVPRELLQHIQSGMLKLDAKSDADANSKARLLGLKQPLLTIPAAFDEVQQKLKEGWVVTDDFCPISAFPLLRSSDGTVMWSVRAQMPTMTRQGMSETTTPVNPNEKKFSIQGSATPIHSVVPLPDDDSTSEKFVAAKASAVDLGTPLLSMKEAFKETSKRLLQGWVLLNDTCPVSNFPLLKSKDGAVVWSVRCQCEIATESQAETRGLQEADSSAVSSPRRSTSTGGDDEDDEDDLVYPEPRSNGMGGTLGGRTSRSGMPGNSSSDSRNSAAATAAKQREAIQSRQSALISEKLLQGWKMLSEVCPETGTVPLMEQPGTFVGKVFCFVFDA